MSKLRQSILAAVDRNLRKFEEKVRNTRDKRTEAAWDFTKYFLCHVSGLPQVFIVKFTHSKLHSQLVKQEACLSDFGILGRGATCKCLKLIAMLGQQAFRVCTRILLISRQSYPCKKIFKQFSLSKYFDNMKQSSKEFSWFGSPVASFEQGGQF